MRVLWIGANLRPKTRALTPPCPWDVHARTSDDTSHVSFAFTWFWCRVASVLLSWH